MISQPKLFNYLTLLDWAVFCSVLLLTLVSVLYGQRLKKELPHTERLGSLELLLMGRSLTMPLFVATLVATWYGGIFGVTALTFEKGIYNFLTQGIFWYATYLIFAFFLVKRIRNHKVLTIAELAGHLFGPRAERVTAGLNFLNLLPIAYTLSLGIFTQSLFGGSLFLNTLIGVSLVAAWSIWGGFRAVVYSDVVQFFFMISGVVLVVVFAWSNLGSPMELISKLPPGHLDISGGESLGTIMVWGFIALSTLVDPNFYQRCLAAKSDAVAKKGIIISTFIWIGFDLCTTLGALYARAALPDGNPQNAYMLFSLDLLPSGLRGLFLAGILATILSTLDAYLFNAATCVSYDFFKLKDKFKTWHHHLGIIFVTTLSLLLGTHFEGNIVEVWKTLGSFAAACLLFPLLMGQLLPGRISETAFCWAVSLGCVGIVAWRIFAPKDLQAQLDPFYVGLLLTTTPLIPSILKKNN